MPSFSLTPIEPPRSRFVVGLHEMNFGREGTLRKFRGASSAEGHVGSFRENLRLQILIHIVLL